MKILMPVIQFAGGPVDRLSFQTSIALLVTFCVFPVSFPLVLSSISELPSSLGSAVAVERIFLGGRDTISLQCASLKANTICVLMLVKKRLHLTRARANAALHKAVP